MNHTQLRAFHALGSTGGFSKAAASLNVTQPAISRQLKSIEEDYGCALFYRRGHQLELTELGRELFVLSQQIFGLMRQVDDVVAGEAEFRTGNLRVGVDSPFYCMDILSVFMNKYPAIMLSVTIANADNLFRALVNYDIDIALVTGSDLSSEFFGIEYLDLELVLLVPPDHVWYNQKTISLSMIKNQPVILREPTSLTRKTFMQSIENKGISSPNVVMELDNQVAVREAVAAGIGVAPELANLERQRDGIHRIRFVDPQVVCKKYIACKKDRSTLRKIVEFFKISENTKS